MQSLEGRRAVVTGASRGLGRGIVEALRVRGMEITGVARDRGRLAELAEEGVNVRAGDAADAQFIREVVSTVRPSVLILNAGAVPTMGALDEQTWETFSTVWDTDVKSGLFGIQAALGTPLSGSYAGAKRMLLFMAAHANDIAKDHGLEITFQALVPLQMIDTELTRHVAGEYARRQGVTVEAVFRRHQKPPLSAHSYGEVVATLLTDPQYANGVAYGVDGGGITPLTEG